MGEEVLSTEQTQRSLWLGDLAGWIDEGFLYNLFVGTNQLVSVKLIRNRATGTSEGYAFLEFRTHEGADTILKTFNGHPIPGTDIIFRLNWAAYGVGKAQPSGEDHSLFVGDLAPDVSDMILQEYFRQFYPSVRSAKVITDATTGRSKGYGFVRFASEPERNRALAEMNGHFLSNRPIRVSLATARKNPAPAAAAVQAPHPSDFDPTNTTLFIGGLSAPVSEEQLRAVFGRFGDIIYVKIPQGKGCGFVQFVLRTSAERALAAMNGQILGASAIRISWGRSSSRAATQVAQLASLAGLPPGAAAAAAAAAGFPGGFNDAALLAAAGGYPPHFGGPPGGLLPGVPYASAFVGGPGGPPPDMFGGFVPGMTAAFQGMSMMPPQPDADGHLFAPHANGGPMMHAHANANGNAMVPGPSSAVGTTGIPPVASAGGSQGGSSGPPSSSGTGPLPSPTNGGGSHDSQSQANGDSSDVPSAAGDAIAEVGVEKGYVPGKGNVALVGAHLFASLLG